MDIKNKIITSVEEIFSSMVMMPVSPRNDVPEVNPLIDSISAVIGFAGARKGVLAVHMPQAVAMAVTSSFLMMDVTEMNEDVDDAIGELANMLGGDIKSILSENGRDIDLSVPTTISGHSYDFQSSKDNERFLVTFEVEKGTFCIDCQLVKSAL